MARRLTKLNDAGVRHILTGAGVARFLEDWGRSAAMRAGASSARVQDAPGDSRLAPRARVRVFGDHRREADTGYLSGSIGRGR